MAAWNPDYAGPCRICTETQTATKYGTGGITPTLQGLNGSYSYGIHFKLWRWWENN